MPINIPPNAVITVKDNGLGIKPEAQKNLFKPQYTVKDISYAVNGMGIGLVLCKMLIELHKGEIWAHSKGKGSTFGFSLPLGGS
jgi:signal transduction histidine kinase